MGHIVIAPVGDNHNALFVGMKEFPTEKVILLSPKGSSEKAKKLAKKLGEFTINTEIMEIGSNVLAETFKTFNTICSTYKVDDIIVNVGLGDIAMTCATLSAAFANGLRTYNIVDDKPVLMPVMKMSYYEELSSNKMRILHELGNGEMISLKDLSEKLGMSSSLLYYHINGNYKYKGLKELRLVDTEEERKNLYIKLSEMGKLLLNGYKHKKK